jgi:uncharacterized protein (UPF0332 family)/predicted nucleotidyltransferase
MEFKLKERSTPVQPPYSRDDIEIAYGFSRAMYREFGKFVRAVVLFGSAARERMQHHNDIDIMVIVDDVSFVMTAELVEAYRVITENYVAKHSTRIHVTTLKFTSFWDYIRAGDPVGVNILRDGVALIDTGFFYPMQMLLLEGRIRPSKEAVQAYMSRGTSTINNSSWHITQATLDLYWACIDSCHAALMKIGEMPPSPREISKVLEEKLVKTGYIQRKYAKTMDNIYHISKKILHKEIKEVSGKEYDYYKKEAESFVEEMKRFVEKR